jgi:hypothetical protein
VLRVIIGQGIEEGVLAAEYPDVLAQIVMGLLLELNEVLGRLLISHEPGPDALRPVTRVIAAYGDAIERVLQAPSGAVLLVDTETLETWFTSAESAGEAS